MARIVKAFRLDKEIIDRLEAQSNNASEQVRLYILSGLEKANLPHHEELDALLRIEEQVRRLGINLNQATRILHIEFSQNRISEQTINDIKKVCKDTSEMRLKLYRILEKYYGQCV